MESVNFSIFKKSFDLGDSINHDVQSTFFIRREIESRIKALAISIFSAASLLVDIPYIVIHTLKSLKFAIVYRQSPVKYASTSRNIAVVAIEFFKHVAGTLFGSLVGIISPTQARSLFLPSNQHDMETRPQNMTEEEAGKIYKLLQIIDTLFEKHKIPYRMTGGTQLGAVRHGGIIPWDDDADLFVLEEDKEKIFALKAELEARGIGVVEHPIGIKFVDLSGRDVEDAYPSRCKYKYPFVDLCFAKKILNKNNQRIVTYVHQYFQANYAGEYFTEEEWDASIKQKFGPIELYGNPYPKKFCKRAFGQHVMKYGFQILNHRTFQREFPHKFYLQYISGTGKCSPITYSREVFDTSFISKISSI